MSSEATIIADLLGKDVYNEMALLDLKVLQIEYDYKKVPLERCLNYAIVHLSVPLSSNKHLNSNQFALTRAKFNELQCDRQVVIKARTKGMGNFVINDIHLWKGGDYRDFSSLSDMLEKLDKEVPEK
ncbi:MAG: hypothetical protein IJ184_05960 [Alphaproteobacteria bacterium]|nr:hypothetical protein [Alphaproteobacteria bacterium]